MVAVVTSVPPSAPHATRRDHHRTMDHPTTSRARTVSPPGRCRPLGSQFASVVLNCEFAGRISAASLTVRGVVAWAFARGTAPVRGEMPWTGAARAPQVPSARGRSVSHRHTRSDRQSLRESRGHRRRWRHRAQPDRAAAAGARRRFDPRRSRRATRTAGRCRAPRGRH